MGPALSPSSPTGVDPERGSGAPILVVDDDPAFSQVVAMILTSAGYRVVSATSGDRALELTATEAFSVVLLDNRMPRMGGLEVLRELRQNPHSRTLPVILITAADELAERVAGLDAGANDYLTKPVEPEELLARVRAQLRGREAWLEVLESVFEERTTIVRSLGAAIRQPDLERVAELICDELTALGSVTGATLVWFTPDKLAIPLASSGETCWGLRLDEPIPPAMARYLAVRAGVGPWVERGDLPAVGSVPSAADFRHPGGSLPAGGPAAAVGLGQAIPLAHAPVACAPLGPPGVATGLLLLSTDASTPNAGVNSTLAAAIDFAQMATGLLRAAFEEQGSRYAEHTEVLAGSTFVPHYQPIVRIADGTTVGYEALTRFADGMSPEARFERASAVGLGIDLERATMDAAIAQSRGLPSECWLGLNASPALLVERDPLAQSLRGAPHPIVLEISEHDPVEDYETLQSSLDTLGPEVMLSVDDAGSGFASLRHVLMLHPAYMKLDRYWVHDLDLDLTRRALVAGLVSFAERTGSILIAEGVETELELEALFDLGVELAQGFLLGRPAPAPVLTVG